MSIIFVTLFVSKEDAMNTNMLNAPFKACGDPHTQRSPVTPERARETSILNKQYKHYDAES